MIQGGILRFDGNGRKQDEQKSDECQLDMVPVSASEPSDQFTAGRGFEAGRAVSDDVAAIPRFLCALHRPSGLFCGGLAAGAAPYDAYLRADEQAGDHHLLADLGRADLSREDHAEDGDRVPDHHHGNHHRGDRP